MNRAAGERYRSLLFGAGVLLMEYSGNAEPYKYLVVERSTDHQLHEALNTAGARGYRVVSGMGRSLYPARTLLMEKAPGRPNQYQYVLENGHHLTTNSLGFPKDVFYRAPELIAARVRLGYSPRAQCGVTTILEKAAEPTGDPSPCAESGCYELRVLNAHKNFASSLSESGARGLRFVAATGWAGWSTAAVVALLVRDGAASAYEYRTIPAAHSKIGPRLEQASADGFCVRGQVMDVLVLERSPAGRRCECRLVFGPAGEIERDLEKAAGDGFLPVLLNAEAHGFNKRTLTDMVIAERVAGEEKQ